ncbi:MAG: hypothetical protein OZ921_00125 [Sorangiineae bacterium]|nr:hypothetical protein [Polyangiaceae bacterium]MEB2320890.1 hypothetical protein [Sorangiineae bacterium]
MKQWRVAGALAALGAVVPAPTARADDASGDRVIVMPTATTHPKGTFYASSTELVLLQVGYAASDTTQLSLTATPPLGEDHIFPLDVTLKSRFVDAPGVRVAALGSATGISGLGDGPMFVGRAGGVVQLCFDPACGASASVATNLLLAGPAMFAMNGAGVVVPVASWLSLLGEVETVLPLGREVGRFNGLALAAGARLPYRTWALDLSLAHLVSASESSSATIPWLVFTYRLLP